MLAIKSLYLYEYEDLAPLLLVTTRSYLYTSPTLKALVVVIPYKGAKLDAII